MQASAIAQEPSSHLDFFLSRIGHLSFPSVSSDYGHLGTPDFTSFVAWNTTACTYLKREKKNTKRVVSSLRLSSTGPATLQGLWNEFNKFMKFHCERFSYGFASVGSAMKSEQVSGNDYGGLNVVGENGDGEVQVMREENRRKRILILMSDTGGGHRASAEAIKAAFNLEFGDEYEVHVTDLWSDHTPWPFNQLPRSYSFLVKHGALWKMTYYGSVPRLVHQPHFAATSAFIARQDAGYGREAIFIKMDEAAPEVVLNIKMPLNLKKKYYGASARPEKFEVAKGLMKYQPDVIISVHPLMQHVPLRILRARGLLKKIAFTTVVTDLSTCHPTWFHKLVTRCYCPTSEVSKRALRAGLQQSQIKVYGLPVRPSFVKSIRPKHVLRTELGMDDELPAVLLMGGGEGMGPIEATAQALGDSLYDESLGEPTGQLIVICGRNQKLLSRLQSIKWRIPVQVLGFVTKMEDCMGACDCIITKAGPGTIAEAMIRGLPIILNGYIAGQEAGNVPYVVNHGIGKFSKSPKEIAKIVSEWFGSKSDELKAMSQNALKLARPDAVFKIVNDLHELVQQRSRVREQYASSGSF